MRLVLEEELYRATLIQISQYPSVLNVVELAANLGVDVGELLQSDLTPEALVRNSREHYFASLRAECLLNQGEGILTQSQFVKLGCRLSEALRLETHFYQVCNEDGERIDWSKAADRKLAQTVITELLTACFQSPWFGPQSLAVARQSAHIVYGLLETFTNAAGTSASDTLTPIKRILESVWNGRSSELACPTPAQVDEALTFEVERKYLLHRMPDLNALTVTAVWNIEQGYIPGTTITERVRRAQCNDLVKCTRTVKLGKGVKRIELEDEINEALFNQLWSCTSGQRVTKKRYIVSHEGLNWELDKFCDRDLVLLEIELAHENQTVLMPDAFRDVLSREVTDDKSFTNWALSRMNTET